jgi:endonuclease YncB( thermonuclease family)
MRKIFLVMFLALSCPVSAEPIDSADIRVIDGDTIRVHHKQPNVRLVGFNAPETRRAACEAERELGAKATRRLRDIVGQAISISCMSLVLVLQEHKGRKPAITAEIAER